MEEFQEIVRSLQMKGQRAEILDINNSAFGVYFLPVFHNIVNLHESKLADRIARARRENRLSCCLFTTSDFQSTRCASYLLAAMCQKPPTNLMSPFFVKNDETDALFSQLIEIISICFITKIIGLSFDVRGKGNFDKTTAYENLQKFVVERAWRRELNANEHLKLNSLIGELAAKI
ncbi:hypothetical protein C0V82_02270 [Niveispirillum cyanobacteriorum]|uniref:Uncharacterized protein n=2 Tax=Niveispirillum cyanobacteriorum TaxID=1612173 RepID=A0A2K9N7S4_9PROT|nr:hypothetical protein C0V82_02270 [Niveispirillum cyanobacteriorum]